MRAIWILRCHPAEAPISQSREAHHSVRPHHSPEGAMICTVVEGQAHELGLNQESLKAMHERLAHHGMMADGADPLCAWHMLIRMAPASSGPSCAAGHAARTEVGAIGDRDVLYL
jgi:hypothetical protein